MTHSFIATTWLTIPKHKQISLNKRKFGYYATDNYTYIVFNRNPAI